MLFAGTHLPRLDDKGRLFVPAKWRHDLEPGLVLTKGQEGCVDLWPEAEFESVGAKLAEPTGPEARANARLFWASAHQLQLDKSGRLTVPPDLRAYAGLRVNETCAVIGFNRRIELWDSAKWDSYTDEKQPAFTEGAGEVLPGVM